MYTVHILDLAWKLRSLFHSWHWTGHINLSPVSNSEYPCCPDVFHQVSTRHMVREMLFEGFQDGCHCGHLGLFVCCFTSQVNSYGHCGTVSSPNHTFSWASLNKQLTSNHAHTFACNWQQPFMNDSAEGRRMTVEIISWSISTKVWDRTGIELATPGSAVSFASVSRHVTDCATRPGMAILDIWTKLL